MVDNIFIEETEYTPKVYLNADKNIFIMEGIMVPENVLNFFTEIDKWINKYKLSPINGFVFEYRLEYFNTSSSIILLQMMKTVIRISNQKIVWIVEDDDEDMIEVIGDYNIILQGAINIVSPSE